MLEVNATTARTPPVFKFGEIQGWIELGESVQREAAAFAAKHFQEAKAADFCGDAVEAFDTPSWAPNRTDFLPIDALKALGFQPLPPGPGEEMVATVGIDQHVDDIHGPVLCLVLHNDGLTFRQGKVSHATQPGQWFVFNDSANHGVKETRGDGVYLALVFPLHRID